MIQIQPNLIGLSKIMNLHVYVQHCAPSVHIDVLAVNYGISNTIVLEIP